MQPSTPQKVNNAAQQQLSMQGLPPAPPPVSRSRSVNDVSVYSYMYGGDKQQQQQRTDGYSSHPPPRAPPSHPAPTSNNSSYDYFQYQANYHQYAAELAPNDEAAAFHQYHAQQAAMKRAQSHAQLPPIYDNSTYNAGYFRALDANNRRKQTAPPTKTSSSSSSSSSVDPLSDALPSAPAKLHHAATVGTYFEQMQGGNDLRYELAQVENEKASKLHALSQKRLKLESAEKEQSFAEKDLTQTRKKWEVEREEILKSFGGKLPSFIIESDKLRKDLQNMSNRNEALEASLEVISEQLQGKLQRIQSDLKNEEAIAAQTEEHNVELERRCRELEIEKLELETELAAEMKKEVEISKMSVMSVSNSDTTTVTATKKEEKFQEYPPESTVIQNLLQAQVEFYFSDYNLKRDKRLLSDVVAPPKKGFLALEEVMKLSRIRQLCSEIETLEEALRRSAILTLIREKITEKEDDDEKDKAASASSGGGSDGDDEADDEVKSTNEEKESGSHHDEGYRIWVGRANFEKPREKEFPFRRTVFLFGIPHEKSQEFVNEMLKPFGSISKTQFDLSPDGIDRKIGHRFLNKPRVYTLYYSDNSNKASSMTNLVKVNGLGGGSGPSDTVGGGGGGVTADSGGATLGGGAAGSTSG